MSKKKRPDARHPGRELISVDRSRELIFRVPKLVPKSKDAKVIESCLHAENSIGELCRKHRQRLAVLFECHDSIAALKYHGHDERTVDRGHDFHAGAVEMVLSAMDGLVEIESYSLATLVKTGGAR